MNIDYQIKPMSRVELNLAIDWAAEEGWNPGLHDADAFYAADPSGYLIGYLKDEPVGCISVVKYGDSFGFLGFYIVRPEFRGEGYGYALWQAGINSLQGRQTGLDGVVEQQPNYRKSGFNLAYRNIRQEGRAGYSAPANQPIVCLRTVSLQSVIDYDQPFFPADRERFLRAWLNMPDTKALGYVNQDRLLGYGMIRPCRSGYKIGPLFADSPDIAEELFLCLQADALADSPIYLDTPEVNESALQLAKRYDMQPVFETARMYTGVPPDLPTSRIFGVTTFELG